MEGGLRQQVLVEQVLRLQVNKRATTVSYTSIADSTSVAFFFPNKALLSAQLIK